MTKYEHYSNYHDVFEYHGNTEIERVRKQGGKTVRRDWIMFNSVDEAMAYFNAECGVLVECSYQQV